MAFTAGEINSIANASLDYYMYKGKTFAQTIQKRPLVGLMERKAKTFPGGKGNISIGIKGAYGAGGVNDYLAGYTHNDTVNFYTPANILRANYPWREHHIGITLTHTELKIDGISVVDEEGNGTKTSEHTNREMHVLVGLLEDKLDDFGEQYSRSLNQLLWGDGTTDPKALAGIRSIIVPNPTTGTLGGLSRATYTWWRNRAATAAHAAAGGHGAITSTPSNGGALLTYLQGEFRQLVRYGGRPDTFIAGSDFIAAMEAEFRGNGVYSQSGFSKPQDGSVGELSFQNLPIQYDPTLDDLGLSKRAYIWDSKTIYLMKMEDEWRHTFTPSRPVNQFVMYKSITSTGQLCAQQVNNSLVVDIA